MLPCQTLPNSGAGVDNCYLAGAIHLLHPRDVSEKRAELAPYLYSLQ